MKTLIVEHKTAGEDIAIGSKFWNRLAFDPQIALYLAKGADLKTGSIAGVDGVLYDVVRKLDIEPYKATPIESRKYTQPKTKKCPGCKKESGVLHTVDGLVCDGKGQITTDPGGKLYANLRDLDEAPAEFLVRCLLEVETNPDKYFVRQPLVRFGDEQHESARDLWAIGKQITHSRKLQLWPRNSGACSQYNRLCEYWSVCSGNAALLDDPTLFKRSEPHFTDERILSVSGAKAYATCHRKYFYAFESRMRPTETAKSLSFGKLFHKMLEHWWLNDRDIDGALKALEGAKVFDQFDAIKATALMHGYHARWSDVPMEVVAVEADFVSDLIDPDTGEHSKEWRLGGVVDGVARI